MTTVEPRLAYVPTVFSALRRNDESMVRSGRSSVGTEIRKCVARNKLAGLLSYCTLRPPSLRASSFSCNSRTRFSDTSNPMTG